MSEFETELAALINRHSKENASETPDYILAEYLMGCLKAWNFAVASREDWYGRKVGRLSGSLAPPSPQNPGGVDG